MKKCECLCPRIYEATQHRGIKFCQTITYGRCMCSRSFAIIWGVVPFFVLIWPGITLCDSMRPEVHRKHAPICVASHWIENFLFLQHDMMCVRFPVTSKYCELVFRLPLTLVTQLLPGRLTPCTKKMSTSSKLKCHWDGMCRRGGIGTTKSTQSVAGYQLCIIEVWKCSVQLTRMTVPRLWVTTHNYRYNNNILSSCT